MAEKREIVFLLMGFAFGLLAGVFIIGFTYNPYPGWMP